jgi:hypothetical protein
MKKLIMILLAGLIAGCGYSSRDNELIGQVKKVKNNTPIICSDYHNVDISLGVMRNGVGSMSTQDKWLVVTDSNHLKILKQANETGQLVKIKYNEKRVAICTEDEFVIDVEIIK